MRFDSKDIIDIDPEKIKNQLPRFKKEIGKWVTLMVVIIVGALAYTQGTFTVSEQENAVITTAGRVTDVKGAGLHFIIPFIQRAEKVNMTTRGMTLGYMEGNNGNMGMNGNNYVDPSETGDNLMISNDFNIVSIDFYAEWRVTDPVKLLYNVQDPETLLNNIIQSSARDIVSAYKVDSVLTDGKSEIQTNIRELVSQVLDDYDIGIMVTNIIIQDAEPPTMEVTEAFKAVEDAKQKKDTLLNGANKYYNENIPGARAEADKIVKQAEAVKEARINEANGQVARFNKMFSEYINNPDITRTRMYLETMEEILPNLKIYIDTTDDGILKRLDLAGQEG